MEGNDKQCRPDNSGNKSHLFLIWQKIKQPCKCCLRAAWREHVAVRNNDCVQLVVIEHVSFQLRSEKEAFTLNKLKSGFYGFYYSRNKRNFLYKMM